MSRDLRQLLEDTAAEPTRPVDPSDIVGRARRRTWTSRAAGFAVVVLVVVGGIVGLQRAWETSPSPEIIDQPDQESRQQGWRQLPEAPLQPRHSAHTVAVDGRLLVIGGTSADPCPPAASCVGPQQPPHRDGAIYDPTTGTWTAIADAPVPVGSASAVVLDGTVYLWIPGTNLRDSSSTEPGFVAYHVDEDRWEQLPQPPQDDLTLAPFGDRVVAYHGTQEVQVERDFVYDPANGTWGELPVDPLAPSYDRTMVWTGDRIVLIAPEAVEQPGSERPSLYRVATLAPGTGQWRRLPDSQITSGWPYWFHVDGKIVNPSVGTADGGQTNNWGRSYPHGGILDLSGEQWQALPDPPAEQADFRVHTTVAGEQLVTASGWVFNAATEQWTRLPVPEAGPDAGHAAAWIDDRLYVFGGIHWAHDYRDSELLDTAWVWIPPSPATDAEPSVPEPQQLDPASGAQRLTDEQVQTAVQMAVDEPATRQILEQHDIDGVYVQAGPRDQLGGLSTWVAFMFPSPTEPKVDPYTDMCDIGGQTDQWLGVVVRVGLDDGDSGSSSPIWTTGADCASWSGLDHNADTMPPPGEKTLPGTPACAEDAEQAPDDPETVAVYFPCGVSIDLLKPVTRTTASGRLDQRLTEAITQFAQGPTSEEQERGYQHVFPGDPSLLAGVEHRDNSTVVVSFDPAIRGANGPGTASATLPFVDGLRATTFQFDQIEELRLEIDGECWPIDPYGRCTFTRN